MIQVDPAECNTCPFNNGQGPIRSEFATVPHNLPFNLTVVADNPDWADLRNKKPLQGRSGTDLEKILAQVGLKRNQVDIVYSALCFPEERAPKVDWNKAIKSCSPRLKQDIPAEKKKRLVMLMGDRALYSICGPKHKGLGAWRGFPIEPLEKFKNPNIVYFPVQSPFAISKMPALMPVTVFDWRNAFAYMKGELQPLEWPFIVTGRNDRALRLLSELAAGKHTIFSLDVETAGKEPLTAPLICIGIATAKWAICFQYKRGGAFEQILANILSNPSLTFVGQNLNHDVIKLMSEGFTVNNKLVDILNAGRTRFPELDHDLMSLASYFDFVEKWKLDYAEDKGDESWEIAFTDETAMDRMMIYCAKDSAGTLRVWNRIQEFKLLEDQV